MSQRNKEIRKQVDETYLYKLPINIGYDLVNIQTIDNSKLNDNYSKKLSELKASHNYTQHHEKFLFKIVKSEEMCKELALNGFTCTSSYDEQDFILGDACKGVHLLKHIDVALLNEYHRLNTTVTTFGRRATRLVNSDGKDHRFVYCVLVKALIGSMCFIRPNPLRNKNVAPNKNGDCHLSCDLADRNQALDVSYQNSSVYVYDFDSNSCWLKKPRNLLPICILKYKLILNDLVDSNVLPINSPVELKMFFNDSNKTRKPLLEITKCTLNKDNIEKQISDKELFVNVPEWRLRYERYLLDVKVKVVDFQKKMPAEYLNETNKESATSITNHDSSNNEKSKLFRSSFSIESLISKNDKMRDQKKDSSVESSALLSPRDDLVDNELLNSLLHQSHYTLSSIEFDLLDEFLNGNFSSPTKLSNAKIKQVDQEINNIENQLRQSIEKFKDTASSSSNINSSSCQNNESINCLKESVENSSVERNNEASKLKNRKRNKFSDDDKENSEGGSQKSKILKLSDQKSNKDFLTTNECITSKPPNKRKPLQPHKITNADSFMTSTYSLSSVSSDIFENDSCQTRQSSNLSMLNYLNSTLSFSSANLNSNSSTNSNQTTKILPKNVKAIAPNQTKSTFEFYVDKSQINFNHSPESPFSLINNQAQSQSKAASENSIKNPRDENKANEKNGSLSMNGTPKIKIVFRKKN